jgi:hypothetical protein
MPENLGLNDAIRPAEENNTTPELPTTSQTAAEFRNAQLAMAPAGGEKFVQPMQLDFGKAAPAKSSELLLAQASDATAGGAKSASDKTETPAAKAEAQKEAAALKKIAQDLDKTGTLDTRTLVPIIQKHIQGSATPRQDAQKVLSEINKQSHNYELTIQGIGKNVMVYRAAKVENVDSDLIQLPGIELNDRRPSQPRHGIRR